MIHNKLQKFRFLRNRLLSQVVGFAFAFTALASSPVHAVTNYTVTLNTDSLAAPVFPPFPGFGSPGELRYILNTINMSGSDTYNITFAIPSNTITLAALLPILNLTSDTNILNIDGTNPGNSKVIIDGNAHKFPGFVVRQGTVSLSNMTIQNTLAQGGNGGGGALGAGGGLFLIGGETTISNLTFSSNMAAGGSNIYTSPLIMAGGGGMYKGNPATLAGNPNGGAGGMGGAGGNSSGGGGGIGDGKGTPSGGGAVAQGGSGAPTDGANGFAFGAQSGGLAGGNGGFEGGGGGGANEGGGGSQGAAGGGDGGETVTSSSGSNGGFGGGGGSAIISHSGNGGAGGFGGGGGGAGNFGTAACGNGGFGGGGGSGGAYANIPGKGGFGAGGGNSNGTIGAAGVGGGTASPNGGAGFGGAIFVNAAPSSDPAFASYYNIPTGSTGGIGGGAQLIISGSLSISGTSVTGGGSGAGLGAAVGPDIFSTTNEAASSAIIFNIAALTTQTYSRTIVDDSLNSIPAAHSWTPGFATGANVQKTGAGTLALGGTNLYSGGTNLNQGTLQVLVSGCLGKSTSALTFTGGGTLTLQAGAGGVNIPNPILTNNNANTFDTQTFGLILSGQISGPGTLNKIGSSTLTLTSALNNFTGPTNIQAGTLALTGIGILPPTGSVNLSSNATFDISGITTSSVTIGDLTAVNNTADVNLGNKHLIFGTTTPSITFPGLISGTGGQLTKQGTGTVQLTNINTYTGLTSVTAGTLIIDTNTLPSPGGGINITTPGIVEFNRTPAELTGTYGGNINGTGAVIASGGVSAISASTISFTGANNYSGGTTINPFTVLYGSTTAIQGNISNSGIVDFEGTGTYGGVITGGGITEINGFGGSGTITFNSKQLYNVRTSIAAGTLALIANGDISSASQLQIASGATFDISGLAPSPASTIVGELINTGGGNINLGNNILITSTANTPATYAGNISGSSSSGFVKQGTGVLILSSPVTLSSFLGTTTVSAGTLQIAPYTLVGNILDNANLDFEQSAGSGTYAGVISGTGAVFINNATPPGSGTVKFTGLNTYTGLTTVSHGNLVISQTTTNTFSGPFSVASGTSVDFDQLYPTIGTFSGTISGAGNVAINQGLTTGTVILSGALQNTGTTHVFAGTLELLNSTSVSSSTPITVNTGANVDFEQVSGTGTYSGGIISGGNVIVNQSGNTGTIVLTGTSTYTGTTTVDSGVLEIFNNVNATFVSPTITINSPGTLDLEQAANTTQTYSGQIVGNGNLDINEAGSTGTVYLAGTTSLFTGNTTVFNGTLAGTSTTLPTPINVNTGGTVDIEQPTGSATYSGIIQDNGAGQHGAVAINKLGGTGIVVFSGANSYTGGTTVYNGTLQGTFASLEGTIAVNTLGSVDIEQPSGQGTFTGTITDNGPGQHGSVTINLQGGTGTVIYSTVNTYTGGTTIYKGILETQPPFVSGNIAIKSGASFDIEQPTSSATFSGNISGQGDVVINSAVGSTGTVTLSGNNSYTGGTVVDGGTLQGDTNSLFGKITDNANVSFIQNSNGTFNGTFLGPGNISITGPGVVTFNTSSALFSGTTTINKGSLFLNNILGGNVIVQSLGNLLGTGTVLGNVTVQNKGSISPGNASNNALGTLTIGGDYHQESGGIYNALINPTGQSTLLDIGGHATLDPGSVLLVTPINGVPAVNTIYTILSAAGGESGKFTSVTVVGSLLTPVVTYDGHHVFLELIIDYSPFAITYNQKQVANQLVSLGSNPPAAFKEILQQLISIPKDQASLALSQMSAEQYTNIILTAELANRQFLRRLYDPLRTIITTNPCKPVAGCNYIQNYDTWASISGGKSFIHGNENARGFRMSDFEVSGGAQLTFLKRWTAGAALSYEKDSIQYKVGGSGKNHTILGGIYTLYRHKRFYAVADGIVGYSEQKVNRVINIGTLSYRPKGHPKVFQSAVYAEVGTEFAIDDTLIQPFLGIEWGHYRFNTISENCGSPLDVNISRKSKSNAYTRLGVHITTPPLKCGFSMDVDLAWNLRLTNLGNNITVQFQDFGTPFNIRGAPFYRNSYEGTVRFAQTIYKQWEFFTEASCQGWKDSTTFSFIGGVKATW